MRQAEITSQAIEEMIQRTPRRWRLGDGWTALKSPKSESGDWSLTFPFPETFSNLCEESCPVRHIGVRVDAGRRAYTYLRCSDSELDEVRDWLAAIGRYIAMSDCLALSFALDFDREAGNPANVQTRVGKLRSEAKPYDRPPTPANFAAAEELAADCVTFLESMPCFDLAEAVLSMPPSSPDKGFDLPSVLADRIAQGTALSYDADALRTIRARPQLKNVPLEEKLSHLAGTIAVDPSSIRGKTVLLVDDLYQSGVSMNYIAMLLQQAGAETIFGLAVEKTCRNDDNTGGPA